MELTFKQIHKFFELLNNVLWRYIPDTPHVKYCYVESEHYILKFPDNKYAFVIARSPQEAYENYLKLADKFKEAKC